MGQTDRSGLVDVQILQMDCKEPNLVHCPKLKGNVLDSLETTHSELNKSESTVENQASEIDALKAKRKEADRVNQEKLT